MAVKDKLVAIRINGEWLAHIDDLATKDGITRSAMIRKLLVEASTARTRR